MACALAVFLLALATALPGNGSRRPVDAHEAFVARTAVEMERRGDLIVPYFDAQQRLQKPPLSYWLAMVSSRVCGNMPLGSQTEFSARLPSIVLGALTAVLVAALGWVLFSDAWIALLAGSLFATNSAYVVWARSAQPEMAYTFFCSLFLLAAAVARRKALAGRGSWRAALCAFAAIALAILAKGPILPVLLLIGVGIGLRKRAGGPGFLRTLHVPAGLLLMLVLVLPYFALVVGRVPGAIEFWRAQMFDRTGGVAAAWWKPLQLFYVGQAIGLWMPWSLILIAVPFWFWRTRRAQRRLALDSTATANWGAARLLGWCALIPCLALSFSAGRKGYYLLPTFVPLSLLMAWTGFSALRLAREHEALARGTLRALRAHAVLFAGLAIGLAGLIAIRRPWMELGVAACAGLSVLLAVALVLALWSLSVSRRIPLLAGLLLIASASLATFAAGASGVHSRVRLYTTGEFARAVERATDHTRQLIVIGGDSQVLLFYTDRTVTPMPAQDLRAALAGHPASWIVQNESQVEAEGLEGHVILREERAEGEDPMVLVDPAPLAGTAPPPVARKDAAR